VQANHHSKLGHQAVGARHRAGPTHPASEVDLAGGNTCRLRSGFRRNNQDSYNRPTSRAARHPVALVRRLRSAAHSFAALAHRPSVGLPSGGGRSLRPCTRVAVRLLGVCPDLRWQPRPAPCVDADRRVGRSRCHPAGRSRAAGTSQVTVPSWFVRQSCATRTIDAPSTGYRPGIRPRDRL
jgi:hypothetical protein